jgi:hypothetical protein
VTMSPTLLACGMVFAEKMPQGLILSNMVFNKISKGGSGEIARLAWLARMILVEYVEPKRFFLFF